MTTAGQEEDGPGDESEGIHYFDFSDPFGPDQPDADADPFASEDPATHSATDAARPEKKRRAREEGGASSRDMFESALRDLPDPTAPAEGPPVEGPAAEEPAGEPDVTFSPLTSLVETEERAAERRAQFAATFDAARADPEQPFLAVALRMPVGDPASAAFPVVEEGIRSALHHGDALLADHERLRLVAVLRGRGADAARPLFTHLMGYLREHVADAEEVGHAIAVLSAPDGRPFQRAVDFLAAAYGGP